MRYMGGKYRQAKVIAEHIARLRKPGQLYLEPFLGGASVYARVPEPKQASDLMPDVVKLWCAVRDGWQPPERVTNEDWHRERYAEPSALRAFLGFGCSFGANFFQGCIAEKRDTTRLKDIVVPGKFHSEEAHSQINKKRPGIVGVIEHKSYDEHGPCDAIIYCDPPYVGPANYATGAFDHERFWATMRQWARNGNTVLVTEYVVPDDVEVLHVFERTQTLRVSSKDKKRLEKLVRVHA